MSNPIKTIVVDDEKNARLMLMELLNEMDDIKVLGNYAGVDEALPAILKMKPDIVFLDVQMPGKNGFELLHEIKDFDVHPTIIFVIAYDEFAIDAIRHSAFDYLLKPVDLDLLNKAVQRYKSEKSKTGNKESINNILKQLLPQKVRFNTRSGTIFIDPGEIIYIRAERNYTDIVLMNGHTTTVSLYISEVYEKLPPDVFLKVSRSAYINLKFIKKLDRKKRLLFLEAGGEQYQVKVGLKYLKGFE